MRLRNKSIICLLCFALCWKPFESVKDVQDEWFGNIIYFCKNYKRLKEEQQTELTKWIDEILSNKVQDIGIRYNFKKCRKAINNHLESKVTLRSMFSKFLSEKNLKSKDYKLIDDARKSIKIPEDKLEELQRFTEDQDISFNIASKIHDQLMFSHGASGKFDTYTNSAVLGSYETSDSGKNTNTQVPMGFEGSKFLTPYCHISEYFSDEGVPLIMETDLLEAKHNSLVLLVPSETPPHFVYVKTPLPVLPPQSRAILDVPIKSFDDMDSTELDMVGGIEYSSIEQNPDDMPEIIDERLDFYDTFEESSIQSESEISEESPRDYYRSKSRVRTSSTSSDSSSDSPAISKVRINTNIARRGDPGRESLSQGSNSEESSTYINETCTSDCSSTEEGEEYQSEEGSERSSTEKSKDTGCSKSTGSSISTENTESDEKHSSSSEEYSETEAMESQEGSIDES